jgi:hypothetical protein
MNEIVLVSAKSWDIQQLRSQRVDGPFDLIQVLIFLHKLHLEVLLPEAHGPEVRVTLGGVNVLVVPVIIPANSILPPQIDGRQGAEHDE